jgi:hypothetical protein
MLAHVRSSPLRGCGILRFWLLLACAAVFVGLDREWARLTWANAATGAETITLSTVLPWLAWLVTAIPWFEGLRPWFRKALAGVGKSTFAEGLISWLRFAGVTFAAIDGDNQHQTLARRYPNDVEAFDATKSIDDLPR